MALIITMIVLYIIARITFFAFTNGKTSRLQQMGFRASLFVCAFVITMLSY